MPRLRPLHALALAAVAALCVAVEVNGVARAQTKADASLTHVICVTNEASTPLTLFVDEMPEASGPRTGYGATPGSSYCYRRVATHGSVASIAVDAGPPLSVGDIRTAADFQRLAAQMQVQRQLPAICEFSPAMVEEADIEQRKAILVRVFAVGSGHGCTASVGVPPAGAGGLDSFDATQSGVARVYYESAERQSFALCIASERRLEVAAWPQVRPLLPAEFLPSANVVRIGGGVPWCSRIWLRPGGDVAILLGAINARQEPNSAEFSPACVISAEMIAQARAGERQGVFVNVSQRDGRRQCATSITAAPERAVGLNAFDQPPVEAAAPS